MNHAHRWRIEEPNGSARVTGWCACGAERRFLASSEYEFNGMPIDEAPAAGRPDPTRSHERVNQSRRRSGEISHQRATERRALNG